MAGVITVRNSGPRRGKAVLQVYVERVSPSAVDRPVRWLGTFETVRLDSGAQARVAFTVPGRRFMHWDQGWRTEPGTYRLVASLSGAGRADADAVVELTSDHSLAAEGR